MDQFQILISQAFLGLVNGAFYALLSLGLSLVFGSLRITNFAHGTFFMLGAFFAWLLQDSFSLGFFSSLLISPLIVLLIGFFSYRVLIETMSAKDIHASLLLTFGLSLFVEGLLTQSFGNSGMPFEGPEFLSGTFIHGLIFIPHYRVFVLLSSLLLCALIYLLIEKTLIGSKLRAIQERPLMCSALGLPIKRYLRLTFAFATALAVIAGVLSAPLIQVKPSMGNDLIIVVFAIVVIGGMGSLKGSIIAGLSIGLLEGAAKAAIPEASNIVVFLLMSVILAFKPTGLFKAQGRSS